MKEQCNAIYTMSGKVLGHDDDICEKENIAKEVVEPLPSENEVLCEKNMEKTLSGKNKQEREEASKWNYSEFKPQASYPMKKKKKDPKLGTKQFERFVAMMKKVYVNISLEDLLINISNYTKFIKEWLQTR